MTSWTDQQLRTFGDAGEIRLATERPDGTERGAVPIWVVRAGDDVFIRSYNGPGGTWYRQVLGHPRARITAGGASVRVNIEPVTGPTPEVDAAYAAKYGRGGYGAAMTRPDAAATTLRLHPADG